MEFVEKIRGHENPVCTLVTKKNKLFSGSLKKIKVCLPIMFGVWNLYGSEFSIKEVVIMINNDHNNQ